MLDSAQFMGDTGHPVDHTGLFVLTDGASTGVGAGTAHASNDRVDEVFNAGAVGLEIQATRANALFEECSTRCFDWSFVLGGAVLPMFFVARPDGSSTALHGQRFVLANGTIEIARLLLACAAEQPQAPGAGNPWVGAGFQDHLEMRGARVHLLDKPRFLRTFQNIVLGGHKYQPKLRLATGAAQALHGQHGRLHRRQHGQDQVQEDEGIGIERPRREKDRVEKHPGDEEEHEPDDEGPGAADGRYLVRQPFAEARLFVRGIGDVAADGAALVDLFEHMAFFRLEFVDCLAK